MRLPYFLPHNVPLLYDHIQEWTRRAGILSAPSVSPKGTK
jgi:hypothetical protein